MEKAKKPFYAICEGCKREMSPGTSCTVLYYQRKDIGDPVYRIPNTDEVVCHDCNCGPNQLHHLGCDMERCPLCHMQLISCNCKEI